jgi:hypothetical protein
MKFLKTFENYSPATHISDIVDIDQKSPELTGKKTVTEFDLSEDEMPEDDMPQYEDEMPEDDMPQYDDVMPEGISPLGESRSERSTMSRRDARKSREEIMKMIRQKAGAARRRQMLASKPQD